MQRMSIIPAYQICIDEVKREDLAGRLYCGCLPEGETFAGVNQLIIMLDKIMDDIGYPQSTLDKRTFIKREPEDKGFEKKNKEVLLAMRRFATEGQSGEKATFVLEVQFRQNASWQGTIKWVEKDETIPFESALEMIKIIDGAVADGYDVEVENKK